MCSLQERIVLDIVSGSIHKDFWRMDLKKQIYKKFVQNNLYYSGKVFIVESACAIGLYRTVWGAYFRASYAMVNRI